MKYLYYLCTAYVECARKGHPAPYLTRDFRPKISIFINNFLTNEKIYFDSFVDGGNGYHSDGG